ncbi:neuropeptide FF receptor 2-like [Saccoglossus kowalevskii]|uniref:Neuropeptide FF receptor 2-like n=1 Tax=Saccoglossus kowalevskii TaxID=10224 RepID=A0ABM0GS89_SACKO|nr:PREDICTED: neuropeptide FF receptor 2-like [Saccoglossus kowalevskii]
MEDNTQMDSNGDQLSMSYDYDDLVEKAAKLNTPPEITVAFGILFMTLIIVGNTWVIIAVFRQPKLRNSATSLFIVSLSVSDLMIAVFFIPYHVGHFAYSLPISNRAVCKLFGYLHWAAQCGTTFSLIGIAVDRYRAIVLPMKPKLTVQHALIGCAIVWSCALGYSSFKLSVNDVLVENKTVTTEVNNVTLYDYEVVHTCYVRDEDTDRWFRLTDLVLMYILPLLILLVLYSIMIFTLWFSESPTNASSHNKKKAVRMLSFVVLQFALTWLPNHILQFYFTWSETFPRNEFLWSIVPANLAIFIFLCNSWINPFLYAYFHESFRKEFKKLFPCFYNCRKTQIQSEVSATSRNMSKSKGRASYGAKTQVSTISTTFA